MYPLEQVEQPVEHAKQIAFESVKADLPAEYHYKIRTEQDAEKWTFIILPEGRVRGGGVRVTVSKGANMKILDTIYLQ
jgi:hypothetical protein